MKERNPNPGISRFRSRQKAISRRLQRSIVPLWPGEIDDIVFVVGCPRSGTTMLGRALSRPTGFCYLNEPRYIWCTVEPRLDVWRTWKQLTGRLFWDATDVDPRKRQLLAKWFHLSLTLSGQRRLVEKLPINVFRMRWLSAMFPKAKFVHLIRHGLDTALSLEQAIGRWYAPEKGYESRYWESNWDYLMFEDYAHGRLGLEDKVDIVRSADTRYARSLLVWLCAVWEGTVTAKILPDGSYLEVRYEDLVHQPSAELHRVFEFLNEHLQDGDLETASSRLRTDSVGKPDPDPQLTAAIAGPMLSLLGYEE